MEFIAEAAAQAPNAQATIDQIQSFYLNQGVLGATIVLLLIFLAVAGYVIRHLYGDLKAINAQALADRERLITALDGVADNEERVREALQALRSAFETRAQAIGEVSSQMALTAQETRHGFANLRQASEGLVEVLKDLRGSVRDALNQGHSGGGGRSGGAP